MGGWEDFRVLDSTGSQTSPLWREGFIEIRSALPVVVGGTGSKFLEAAAAALRDASLTGEGVLWALAL